MSGGDSGRVDAICASWFLLLSVATSSPQSLFVFGNDIGWVGYSFLVSLGIVLIIPLIMILGAAFRIKSLCSKSANFVMVLGLVFASGVLAASSSMGARNLGANLAATRPQNDYIWVRLSSDGKSIDESCFDFLGGCRPELNKTWLQYDDCTSSPYRMFNKADISLFYNYQIGYSTLKAPLDSFEYCQKVAELISRYPNGLLIAGGRWCQKQTID